MSDAHAVVVDRGAAVALGGGGMDVGHWIAASGVVIAFIALGFTFFTTRRMVFRDARADDRGELRDARTELRDARAELVQCKNDLREALERVEQLERDNIALLRELGRELVSRQARRRATND